VKEMTWKEFEAAMSHTIHCFSHKQDCPDCKVRLTCCEDYYGGGSHYWRLVCQDCHRFFSYGTYDLELRPFFQSDLEAGNG
jgi:hypothetical protein